MFTAAANASPALRWFSAPLLHNAQYYNLGAGCRPANVARNLDLTSLPKVLPRLLLDGGRTIQADSTKPQSSR